MTQRRPAFFWSRLHFLIRLLGLTGLLVACVGVVLLHIQGRLASWSAALDALRAPDWMGWLVIGGAAAVAPAVLVELLVGLWTASARRGLFGLNAFVQVVLAAALLVGVNVAAFLHPFRFDWTRDQQYTLPADVRADLGRLNDETTVVIYLRHQPAGGGDARPDRYDFAAERKVVEKVKDLVQELRETGPRFRVETLDVEEQGFDDKLKGLTKDSPELLHAVESAPESALFFRSKGGVQSMSFNDFDRLEKVASREADGGRGNLVLAYAGPRKVADRILNVEERKPRVGVLVPHEGLGTNGSVNFFTLSGLKKALNAHGIEVRDVVLKREADGSPAADRPEDSRLARLLHEHDFFDGFLKDEDDVVKELDKQIHDWPNGRDEDGLEDRQEALATHREIIRQVGRQRDDVEKELQGIDQDAVAERGRNNNDLTAKLDRELADCDLLLIPRHTIMDQGRTLTGRNSEFFGLSADQAASIQEFMRQGKPVFACLGPRNEPSPDDPDGGNPPPPDALEKMLGDLGLHFSKKAVLFDGQIKVSADTEDDVLVLSNEGKAPPLRAGRDEAFPELLRSAAAFAPAGQDPWPALGAAAWPEPKAEPQPAARSLRLRERASGRPFDLALKYPRAVYLDDAVRQASPFDPTLLSTGPEWWNDLHPFPPRSRPFLVYFPPRRKDADNGTTEAKRRGPFTVGVALETDVPKRWLTSAADKPARLRVAAIGHGGPFIGETLSPSQEELLLDTCNWLLRRDDRLAEPAADWRYPRAEMSDRDQAIWLWGAQLGLPLLFAFFGAVVLLLRRLR